MHVSVGDTNAFTIPGKVIPTIPVKAEPLKAGEILKDSGARRSFGTGSVRDMATGKGTPHLLPLRAITLASQQMERGMKKYGARNWELGQPLSSYFDSAMRHLWKHWNGWTDEPHLDAFVWNSLCYAETAERIRIGILPKELDDRPTIGKATPEEMGLVE